MLDAPDISPLTLNRLSLYLRALRRLRRSGVETVSSGELESHLQLSAALIRKDLAQFGELGTRGVGYNVAALVDRLIRILGLDRERTLVIVGAGNLGTALAGYLGFNSDSFRVAALFDNDVDKIGRRLGDLEILAPAALSEVVEEHNVDIGVLTVPLEAAQENYELLISTGVRAILNFAPVALKQAPDLSTPVVHVKNVDLRIHLEELSYFLGSPGR